MIGLPVHSWSAGCGDRPRPEAALIEPSELLLLKMEFGLSIAGWTHGRAIWGSWTRPPMGITGAIWCKHGWHKAKSQARYPSETSRLFRKRVTRLG